MSATRDNGHLETAAVLLSVMGAKNCRFLRGLVASSKTHQKPLRGLWTYWRLTSTRRLPSGYRGSCSIAAHAEQAEESVAQFISEEWLAELTLREKQEKI